MPGAEFLPASGAEAAGIPAGIEKFSEALHNNCAEDDPGRCHALSSQVALTRR
jgi:hypothetical protein